ncbi:MAG: hypothetical protein IT308_00445 [Anaerolineaceae bacterium]|nr:hypothetical protein [Anaerolineaceae bacterium]
MPQTTTSCPRCRQPIIADIDQLFDTTADPQAKQKILSGSANRINCPNCGYQGMVAAPIVYHDGERELLLTYFPPELGLPINEQERMIGPLINQVLNRLPPEKRKAYLLRPQTMLTFDTMIERILEADGITKEMIDAQQKRVLLLQRLLSATPESRTEIIQQETELVDTDFFTILNRLIEASMAQGDQQSAQMLAGLQQQLFNETEAGKELKLQTEEAQAAIKSLQESSKQGLTREALLDLMISAPTEIRLSTLVGMTRSGMDYAFFQLLSDRIENTKGEEKEKLTVLREKLLEMTKVIDEAVNNKIKAARSLLEKILAHQDIEKTLEENLERIDEFFFEVVQTDLQEARQSGNLEKSGKLQKITEILQKFTAPPMEVSVIEELIKANDEVARQAALEENAEKITPEFLSFFASLIAQVESQQQSEETLQKLKEAYKQTLRFSMMANLKN